MNPRGSPQRIRSRHLSDEHSNLVIDGWAAVRPRVGPSGPSSTEPVAMPSHDGIRLHDQQAARHFGQIRAKAIQNSRSRVRSGGRLVARFTAVNCCRSARFSNTNS